MLFADFTACDYELCEPLSLRLGLAEPRTPYTSGYISRIIWPRVLCITV